jgi:hypothetical protein
VNRPGFHFDSIMQVRAIRVSCAHETRWHSPQLAETYWSQLVPHRVCDLRRCGTQRDRQALAETLRSGFEFPWGHHD